MTALFNALGARTVHDVYLTHPQWHQDKGTYGVCDPSVAMLFPEHAHAVNPSLCFNVCADSLEDRLDALDHWSGTPLHPQTRDKYLENYVKYLLTVPEGNGFHVDKLNDDDFVADLYLRCTGEYADKEIIKIFQLLKIEEHYPKAKALLDKQRG